MVLLYKKIHFSAVRRNVRRQCSAPPCVSIFYDPFQSCGSIGFRPVSGPRSNRTIVSGRGRGERERGTSYNRRNGTETINLPRQRERRLSNIIIYTTLPEAITGRGAAATTRLQEYSFAVDTRRQNGAARGYRSLFTFRRDLSSGERVTVYRQLEFNYKRLRGCKSTLDDITRGDVGLRGKIG